jgi:hypothetical protein
MRCGFKDYNGLHIPQNVTIYKSKSGREFYVSGLDYLENKFIVRYIDNQEFKQISYDAIKKYLQE